MYVYLYQVDSVFFCDDWLVSVLHDNGARARAQADPPLCAKTSPLLASVANRKHQGLKLLYPEFWKPIALTYCRGNKMVLPRDQTGQAPEVIEMVRGLLPSCAPRSTTLSRRRSLV